MGRRGSGSRGAGTVRRVNASKALERSPAIVLVGTGVVSVQLGAAIATKLFGRVGPAGTVAIRVTLAAVVLAALARVARHRSARGGRSRSTGATVPADRLVATCFGIVLGAMNLSFYEAIARIPLGVAVTMEFCGPLLLALAGSRRWSDGLWALGAGAGVALLLSGVGRRLDPAGEVLALVAGACWAGYILLSKETGRRLPALDGLAWAMTSAAALLLPVGLVAGGTALLGPGVLGLGVVVALLSSVVPYSLELLALRRVTSRAFGVMTSLGPAVATAVGFVVLGQQLDLREWVALSLVVASNLGNTLGGRRAPLAGTPLEPVRRLDDGGAGRI